MANTNLLQPELHRISAALLGLSNPNQGLYEIANDYYQLLLSIHALDTDAGTKPGIALLLPGGKAISPDEAALCIRDHMRTRRFVRGLYLAIQAAQTKFPGTPIHILYAGTGPFATLALPMTAVFGPDEIQFTLLEVQETSHALVQQTISAFELEAYFREIHLVDACAFIPDTAQPIHILVTETMQQALYKEPQVAITLQLAPFLHPEGFLVPQNISVKAALVNPSRVFNRWNENKSPAPDANLLELAEVFQLNRETRLPASGVFPVQEVPIPLEQLGHLPELHLLTGIEVFGVERLQYLESSLSFPKFIKHLPSQPETIAHVAFQYQIGSRPGFKMDFLDAAKQPIEEAQPAVEWIESTFDRPNGYQPLCLDAATKAEMIHHLSQIDSDAARALIANLTIN